MKRFRGFFGPQAPVSFDSGQVSESAPDVNLMSLTVASESAQQELGVYC